MQSSWAEVAMVWASMMQRCYVPSNPAYADYGGRGIRVSERWHDFGSFCEDVLPRPAGLSLDRIDNDGPYSKENTQWATQQQQCSNTRRNVQITIDGRTQTLARWARETGSNPDVIKRRLKRGLDPKEAIFDLRDSRSTRHRHLTFDGKTLSIPAWSRETGIPSCTIHDRLRAGWSVERTLSLSIRGDCPRYEFGGESLTATQWSERTGIPARLIAQRVGLGWPVEKAITKPVQGIGETYSCHGETLTLLEWSRKLDMNYYTLMNRLRRGWPHEKVFSGLVRHPKAYFPTGG